MLADNDGLTAIVGGALGVDTDAAAMAYVLGIPYTLAKPCVGHELRWNTESQRKYRNMERLAANVVLVHNGPYTPWCMQKRNIYMVDSCNLLIAVWDGSSGGTGNCVKYAESKKKKILRIDPSKL